MGVNQPCIMSWLQPQPEKVHPRGSNPQKSQRQVTHSRDEVGIDIIRNDLGQPLPKTKTTGGEPFAKNKTLKVSDMEFSESSEKNWFRFRGFFILTIPKEKYNPLYTANNHGWSLRK